MGVAAEDDDYRQTIDLFRHAGESAWFFQHCYGYAVFPNIGKGAFDFIQGGTSYDSGKELFGTKGGC